MLLLISVTVQKKARGLYHSNECAWVGVPSRGATCIAARNRGRGLMHAPLERTSARGSQASRLEMVVTWGAGPSVIRVNRNACATEKNERTGEPSIPIGDGGYLG